MGQNELARVNALMLEHRRTSPASVVLTELPPRAPAPAAASRPRRARRL